MGAGGVHGSLAGGSAGGGWTCAENTVKTRTHVENMSGADVTSHAEMFQCLQSPQGMEAHTAVVRGKALSEAFRRENSWTIKNESTPQGIVAPAGQRLLSR